MSAQQSRIAGALACFEALRTLEKAAERFDLDETAEEHFAKCLTDSCAFVAALGPMTPEQEGAVTALAEYVHMGFTTGEPNLDPGGWVPMVTMTEAERQAMIERTAAEQAAENEEGATA